MTYTDTDTGEVMTGPPACDQNDPGSLESWYGNFGFFDHYRKSVLADCREIIRAKGSDGDKRLTEARIDDLARVSDIYLTFLAQHLEGRTKRENNVRESFAR